MARKKAGSNQLKAVAKRFGITAREARDIATAVGTLGRSVATGKGNQEQYGTSAGLRGAKERNIASAAKNLKKQVKETGRAAASGKKGSTSDKFYLAGSKFPNVKFEESIMYEKGTKRKKAKRK